MAKYEDNSRFACDPQFKVVTRKGITMGTIVTMPVPVRGSGDSIFVVPLRYQYRWDLICDELFGDVTMKTILMRHNRIEDPFAGPLVGDRLLVPTADQIAYYKNQ